MTKQLYLTAAVILAGILTAVPASAQKPEIQIQKDLVDLQGYVRELQRSMDAADTRNKNQQALIEQLLDKVNVLNGDIQTGIKEAIEIGVKNNTQATQSAANGLVNLLNEIKAQNDKNNAAQSTAIATVNANMNGSIEKAATDLSTKIDRINANIDRTNTNIDKIAPQIAKTSELIVQLGDKNDKERDKLLREIAELKLQLGALSEQLSRHQADTNKVPLPSPKETYNGCAMDALRGDYPDAVDCYKDFVTKFPDDSLAARAELGIGDIAFNQGKWQEAVDSYDVVLQKYLLQKYRDPDTKRIALYKKGLALEKQGKKPEAIKTLTEVKDDNPGTPEAENAARLLKDWQPTAPPPTPPVAPRGGAAVPASRG